MRKQRKRKSKYRDRRIDCLREIKRDLIDKPEPGSPFILVIYLFIVIAIALLVAPLIYFIFTGS